MTILNRLLDHPHFYNFTQLIFNLDLYPVIAAYIRRYPHHSILEIGCGTGELLKYLKPKSYLGIDINLSYLNYATQKFPSTPNTNITFTLQDAKKIKPIKRPVDLVVLINTLHHLSTKDLNLIAQKLIQNVNFAKIIIVDSQPDFGIFTSLLEKLDQGHHFRDLNQITAVFNRFFHIDQAITLKKLYWPYQYPLIVGSKKR